MSQAITRQQPSPPENPIARVGPNTELMVMAKMFADSGFFKDSRSAAQAGVKICAGHELGIPPVAAMTGIHIVKEKVMLGAAVLASVVQRSGKYDFRVKQIDNTICVIEFFQGKESIGISTFGVKEATAAGLMGGDNYRKFTRNMFFARALSNGVKWFCPGVLSGPVYTPEELDIPINANGDPIVDEEGAPKTFTQKLDERDRRVANLIAQAPPAAPASTVAAPSAVASEPAPTVIDEEPATRTEPPTETQPEPQARWSDLNEWRMHCDTLAQSRRIDPALFDKKKAAALKSRGMEADFQTDEKFRVDMVAAIEAGKFDAPAKPATTPEIQIPDVIEKASAARVAAAPKVQADVSAKKLRDAGSQ